MEKKYSLILSKSISVILLVLLLLYLRYSLRLGFYTNRLFLIGMPLVMLISSIVIFPLNKRLRIKIGFLFAIYHLSLIVNTVVLILSGKEPDWPMYWMGFLHMDLPVLPIYLPISSVLYKLRVPAIPFLPTPIGDVRNFIFPLLVFGIFGTLWFFFIPVIIAKLIDKIRPISKKGDV
jgi:hypothetical protein